MRPSSMTKDAVRPENRKKPRYQSLADWSKSRPWSVPIRPPTTIRARASINADVPSASLRCDRIHVQSPLIGAISVAQNESCLRAFAVAAPAGGAFLVFGGAELSTEVSVFSAG